MTIVKTNQPQRRYRTVAPPFALLEPNQEANRKRIIHDLLDEAKKCERRATRCRKIAAQIPALKNLRNLKILAAITHCGVGTQWIANLFGVEDLYFQAMDAPALGDYLNPCQTLLIDCITGRSFIPVKPPVGQPSRELSGLRDPIDEAQRIVNKFAQPEIDWTQEPANERERAIRAKIIEREERQSSTVTAWVILHHYVDLFDKPASDLAEAIERLGRVVDAETARRKRLGIEEARRELDGES